MAGPGIVEDREAEDAEDGRDVEPARGSCRSEEAVSRGLPRTDPGRRSNPMAVSPATLDIEKGPFVPAPDSTGPRPGRGEPQEAVHESGTTGSGLAYTASALERGGRVGPGAEVLRPSGGRPRERRGRVGMRRE